MIACLSVAGRHKNMDATKPRAFVAGSDIAGEMTSATAESIVAETAAWPQAVGASTTVIDSPSEAAGDVDSGAAAAEAANRWLASAHQAVQANSAGGYVDYIEPETTAARYLGDNLVRFNTIRKSTIPMGDVLRYQAVGPMPKNVRATR
jgi:hypothetical protein